MKKITSEIVLLVTILLLSTEIKAQPGGPGGGQGQGGPPPSANSVPIDGGIFWLLAGAAGYGFKTLRSKYSAAEETTE